MKSNYYDRETRSIISLSPPVELYLGVLEPWEINRVSVLPPHRGKGIARRLMAEVLADADTEGITLGLSVAPDLSDTGLDFQTLYDWYTRCGFIPFPTPPRMIRYPRSVT